MLLALIAAHSASANVVITGCVFQNAVRLNCRSLEGAVSVDCIDVTLKLTNSRFCKSVSVDRSLYQVIAPLESEIKRCEFQKLSVSAVKYATADCITGRNGALSGLTGNICVSDCTFESLKGNAIQGSSCTGLRIEKCTFRDINSGSVDIIVVKFSLSDSAVVITGSTFTNIRNSNSGTAMVFDGSYQPKKFQVSECNFETIVSGGNAGVWQFQYMVCDGSSVEIRKSTFKDITATNDGILIYSGARTFSVLMEDCNIDTAKSGESKGGVIYLGKSNSRYSSVYVKNTVFKSVTKSAGCILTAEGGSPITTCTFEGCTIEECSGSGNGLVYARIEDFVVKQTKFLRIDSSMIPQMYLRTMSSSSSATVIFTECTFDSYKSKAIIWSDAIIASIEFHGCTIKGYTSVASKNGGYCAVSHELCRTIAVTGCTFESANSNHALIWTSGSASDTSVTISNTIFDTCSVTADPMVYLCIGSCSIDGCSFIKCTASNMCLMRVTGCTVNAMKNCEFKSMNAGGSDLLVCSSTISELVGFKFDNIQTTHERGICCINIPKVTALKLTNCQFISSSSTTQAGAIKLESFCSGNSASFTGCTFDGVAGAGAVIMSSSSTSYAVSFSGAVFQNLGICAFSVPSVSSLSFSTCSFDTSLQSGSASLINTAVSSGVSFTSTHFTKCGNANSHMLTVGNANEVTFTTCTFDTVSSKSIVYSSASGKIGHLKISGTSLFKNFVASENLVNSEFVKSLEIEDTKFEGGSILYAAFLFKDSSQRGSYAYDISLVRTDFTGMSVMSEAVIHEWNAPLKIYLYACKFRDLEATVIDDKEGQSSFQLTYCEFYDCNGGQAPINLQSAATVSLTGCVFNNTAGSVSTLDISCASTELTSCEFQYTAAQSVLKIRNGVSLRSCEFYGIQGKACDITGTNSISHCLFTNIEVPSGASALAVASNTALESCTFKGIQGKACAVIGDLDMSRVIISESRSTTCLVDIGPGTARFSNCTWYNNVIAS